MISPTLSSELMWNYAGTFSFLRGKQKILPSVLRHLKKSDTVLYTSNNQRKKSNSNFREKKTFFLVSGKIRFLFPYDWALELGSAATTATNKTTNILPCYWNPIADFIKNLECCKTVPYDSPLTPSPVLDPQGPPFPPGSPISRTTAEIPFLIRRTFFAVRGAESLYFTRAYSISASSLSLSLTAMKLFEECVNSQQMRNRRYGGFIFTTPIFFIQITKKFGDVTSMTYIRFWFGYCTCRSWNWEFIPEG